MVLLENDASHHSVVLLFSCSSNFEYFILKNIFDWKRTTVELDLVCSSYIFFHALYLLMHILMSLLKLREPIMTCTLSALSCQVFSLSLLSPQHRQKGDLRMWKWMYRHLYRACLLLHLERWAGCEGLLWEGAAGAVHSLWDPQRVRRVLLYWLLQHQHNITPEIRSGIMNDLLAYVFGESDAQILFLKRELAVIPCIYWCSLIITTCEEFPVKDINYHMTHIGVN